MDIPCLSREEKCEAVSNLRRLAVHHPEILCTNLHTVTLAVIQEAKNLRSQVSRLALICLGDMFTGLKKNMDMVSFFLFFPISW